MKKQRKSAKQPAKKNQQSRAASMAQEVDPGRRRFLRVFRNFAIGAALVGGTGYVFAQNVMHAKHEHDLTRVGNGRPTIVQIHDPQCSLCLALQKETKEALEAFDDEEVDYVIANIRTQKGQAFANSHGVQHVTLLLFDDKGELKDILQGQRGSYQLRAAFRSLVNG